MSQSLHSPLSFLKNPNDSSSSLQENIPTRSRSASIFRAISLHNQSTINEESISCQPEDFEIKNPIGNPWLFNVFFFLLTLDRLRVISGCL